MFTTFRIVAALVGIVSVIGLWEGITGAVKGWASQRDTIAIQQLEIDSQAAVIAAKDKQIEIEADAARRSAEYAQAQIRQADMREKRLARIEDENEYQKELIAQCRIDTNSLHISSKK